MPGKKKFPSSKRQNRKLSASTRKVKKGMKAESQGKTKKAQKKYDKSHKKVWQAASRGPMNIKPAPRRMVGKNTARR